LQIWWDQHAFYPREAVDKSISGTVKVHLWMHPDGVVWTVEVVESSGSKLLDDASFEIFHRARLRPFPPGTPAPRADIFISMHYLLAHRQGAAAAAAAKKSPFTITDEPVKDTVVATMQQRVCTGIVVEGWAFDELRIPAQAVFYQRPDGTPWVKWTSRGGVTIDAPVTEEGASAHWYGLPPSGPPSTRRAPPRYAVWPMGDNRIAGRSEGYDGPPSTLDLTCN